MSESSQRETPPIDFLLDAFNDSKDAISVMTVTYHSNGKFDVYFHGSPAEIAMAMKCSKELDDVIENCIHAHNSNLRTN